jgi:hypothetical protein
LGEYLKTPLRVPYWVNWMQTPNQTQGNQTPVMGENTGEVPQIYKDLLSTVKKYVRLHHNDLKELSDIWLTIVNFIDTVKEAWYENHRDNLLEKRADEILHDPKYDLVIDLLMDLKYWGLGNLTFMELETINTIISNIIGYCMERGYGPDDSLDECLPTGDDA